MPTTSRAALYLCPPPAARLSSSSRADGSGLGARESRVRTHLRPLLRATSRALLRLADFTARHGLMFAGFVVAAATILA
jgi:hypothetical protein